MARTLKVTISVELDGKLIQGFDPLVRVISIDELQPFLPYEKADNADATTFNSLPIEQIATLQNLLLTTNRAVKVRLDGQTDAGIELGSQGVLLVLNGTIDASTTTNATLNNNSGGTAEIDGFGAGT